jgi:putative nucleotidyltransferase with HDIG domain
VSLSILIVEPDQKWCKELTTFFEHRPYEIHTAANGKDAQLLAYKHKFQIAIIDLDVKNHTAFELLRYLQINTPATKILLTLKNKKRLLDFDITESDLRRFGASEIFIKPISLPKLLKCIEVDSQFESWRDIKMNTEEKEALEVKAQDQEFTRIKFKGFFSGSTTIYDHYIRLGKNQYVKILHQGESFEASRLKQYQDANLDFLYFKTSDRLTYINFTNEKLQKILGTSASTIEKKIILTQSVVEKYLEQVFDCGIHSNVYEEGKKICENMLALIEKEPELHIFLKRYEEYDSIAYGHLFLVSFFSIVTCKNLDWATTRTVEAVALGALLHDIGKLKLPLHLREKELKAMKESELKSFQEHPRLGVEMLANYSFIPQSVLQIIYQHHELSDGSGFPNQLNSLKIYPLAKIVSLNDAYTHFYTSRKLSPLAGLKAFLQDRSNLSSFDIATIKALVTGFAGIP